jgi:hypothetical protein
MDHRKGYCCQIAVLHNCCENAEKLIWLRETFPFSTLFIKKYWMIYRWPGFHVVLFFGSSPPPPVSMLGRRHTGRLRNRGVRGWGGAKSYLGEGKPGPLYIIQYSFLFTISTAFSPRPPSCNARPVKVYTQGNTMCVASVVRLETTFSWAVEWFDNDYDWDFHRHCYWLTYYFGAASDIQFRKAL